MTDKQYDSINEQTTVTIDDVIGTKPKTARRAKKEDQFIDEKEVKKEVKRAAKLKGSDVQEMFEKGSQVAIMMGAAPFWYIPGNEVADFADDLAELLNRIPAHYVTGFFDLSGYLTIAFGMMRVVRPRLALQREQKELEKVSQNGVEQQEFAFTA